MRRASKQIHVMKQQHKGVVKPKTLSKPEQAQAQAQAQAVQMQSAEAAEAEAAKAGRWYNPKYWLSSLFSKKGGTRKQRKHRRQRKSFTKRKHN